MGTKRALAFQDAKMNKVIKARAPRFLEYTPETVDPTDANHLLTISSNRKGSKIKVVGKNRQYQYEALPESTQEIIWVPQT